MTNPTAYKAALDDIDDALIGLLAIAYFGPAEQCTSASVRQACAAEVLLFRLRMTREAVRELADAYELPARQDQSSAAVGLNAIARTDGPGPIPSWDGKVAPSDASRLVGRTSGLVGGERPDGSVPRGRHPSAADADFTSPRPLGPPRFVVGERRLVGRVEPVLLNP